MRDKQIEKMALDLCLIDRCIHLPRAECNNTTCAHCEAEVLYNAGYRKASDVVREITNDALAKIQIMISSIKAEEEHGIVTEFNGGAKTALETVFRDIAELKKKYESEEN